MAGVSAIFSLVSCNTPVYSCASVQAPIFLPYNLPVISFKVCSKFISNSILHDSFIFAKMNVPCHTHFFIFFFFVWVLYLFLVSHPLVSAVPWVFPILFGLHTFSAAAPWVFPALSDFSYPRNTEILCMLFSYNTQDSIGKRFPQPFL